MLGDMRNCPPGARYTTRLTAQRIGATSSLGCRLAIQFIPGDEGIVLRCTFAFGGVYHYHISHEASKIPTGG